MNKKQMMKRMIGLSLLAGLFLPIVANADSYTVKSGDNLSKISKEYYGDPNQYNKIFEANRPLLKNADDIFPGQVLRIPQ